MKEYIYIALLYLMPFMVLGAVAAFMADYVTPRCPRLERFTMRLFGFDEKGGDKR